jgi:hypothetical protein
VWPIGVAAVIGIALGFGAGYTVAIRDRAVVPPPAAVVAPAALPQVAVQETTVAVVPPQPLSPSAIPPKTAVDPAQAKADPTPATKTESPVFAGRLLIRSTPSGARLFIDGKDRGQTPATIRDLSQGEHRIRIARDGYADVERRIALSPRQPSQSLSIPLTRDVQKGLASPKPNAQRSAEAGTLIVESRPSGAAVIIDGRQVGTTPMSLGDLGTGSHAVRLERDGYRTWTSAVSISAGAQNRITASLEK